MDEARCQEMVSPPERWGSFHRHQCSRKKWKDGYCKQHHPDSVAERDKKAEERFRMKVANDPRTLLHKANIKINKLSEWYQENREDMPVNIRNDLNDIFKD
ncbi:MAG: hypothetical protein GY861_02740 [bacterium]|nr:hypothetical protein [bacterium]